MATMGPMQQAARGDRWRARRTARRANSRGAAHRPGRLHGEL